jgi:FtsP/CotA-like multicopper oxidase with cupredoxin domain
MHLPSAARRLATLVAFASLGFVLHASPRLDERSLEPPGWDADMRLTEANDLNPDPNIVEINLEARVASIEIAPGLRVDAWTYDGLLPGPLIRVRVGQRLIVHFTNHLPKPTTIHWHGLRIPIQMDGVPGVSQPEVPPGGSFTYDFVVPDAGLFWYHPHVMSAAQVGFGLYGALLVDDPNEKIDVADQLVLVLSDIEIDEATGALESPESGGSAGMAFGREGNHLLVNGRQRSHMRARSGVPQRWRIVNTAKSRFFEVDLGGTPFTVIGGDGGLQEFPVDRDTIVLGPGERIDAIVTPRAAPGSPIAVQSRLFNRGYGSVETRPAIEDLFTMTMTNESAYQTERPTIPRPVIEPLDPAGATQINMNLTIAQDPSGNFQYGINGVPFLGNKSISAHLGETQVWTITNKTKWSHPFHLHGFFFQALDTKGQPLHPLAWKDTLNVPFEETRQFIVRYDDRPGSWMFHCHVLDHAEGGLMGMVALDVPPQSHHHPE